MKREFNGRVMIINHGGYFYNRAFSTAKERRKKKEKISITDRDPIFRAWAVNQDSAGLIHDKGQRRC